LLFAFHIVAMFVSQHIFNMKITIPTVATANGDQGLFGSGRGDGMILSTVPGMVMLGRSGIRVVSRLSSAIRADLDMRGFAISFRTSARARSSGFFLDFLCTMHPC
jgi:hypothetical protein